jgi:site-specific recombinase XerD
MSEIPISPLRRRMIEDMTVRQFVEKTQADYIRHVRTFTGFLGRSPDTATADDLRRFQLHQAETGVRPPSMNGAVAALRFFFGVTLERPELARGLVFVREPRKIPVILSLEEVGEVLEAAPGPKYQAALAAAYGAGLRIAEVTNLKVADIDSRRMLLRIEQGKSLPLRRRGAARTASPSCPTGCWSCCVTGIASPGRRYGCFPGETRSCR